MTLKHSLSTPFFVVVLLLISACSGQKRRADDIELPAELPTATALTQSALLKVTSSVSTSTATLTATDTSTPYGTVPVLDPLLILPTYTVTVALQELSTVSSTASNQATEESTPAVLLPVPTQMTVPRPTTFTSPTSIPEISLTPLQATVPSTDQDTIDAHSTMETPIQLATATIQVPISTSTVTGLGTEPMSQFADCITGTGNNATIAVPADIFLENNTVLSVGDEISIFTPDGSICAGFITWTGHNTAITAWGDDTQTEAIDGLREGEQMLFRIWKQSSRRTLDVNWIEFSMGDGSYSANSLHTISALKTTEG